jgi:diacylglycerol kinase
MARKFVDSLKNAIFGLAHMVKTQRNFDIQLIFAVVALILSMVFPLTVAEWFYITMAIVAVLMAEMINTVAEYLADIVKKEKSIYIQLIKDISASVVLLSVIWALFVGSIVFIPYIF